MANTPAQQEIANSITVRMIKDLAGSGGISEADYKDIPAEHFRFMLNQVSLQYKGKIGNGRSSAKKVG